MKQLTMNKEVSLRSTKGLSFLIIPKLRIEHYWHKSLRQQWNICMADPVFLADIGRVVTWLSIGAFVVQVIIFAVSI
jgi:hypothetical protein